MVEPVAEFRQISKVYQSGLWGRRRTAALREVSLTVEAGEILALVGPNRAGKTTLVKILLSICHATSGHVRRFGAPGRDRGTLARVGYVHESQAFPRYLTAEQLLRYYGALSQMPFALVRERSRQLLGEVGLADRSREPISRFSKGMLQRLALAQAMLNDPALLVLDEPSEGMDLVARRMLERMLVERKQQGKTALLVSHALADIERLADRVAVMRGGQIVKCDTLGSLLEGDDAERSLAEAVEPLYEEASA